MFDLIAWLILWPLVYESSTLVSYLTGKEPEDSVKFLSALFHLTTWVGVGLFISKQYI